MRVVVDTNTWISRLLIAESSPSQAVSRALQECEVVVSEPTPEEMADVLSREKCDRYVSLGDRQEFIRRLLQITTVVPVLSEINDCRDPADNKFLALAFDAEADYLIAGDKDLLILQPWRGIQIVTPVEFLEAQL